VPLSPATVGWGKHAMFFQNIVSSPAVHFSSLCCYFEMLEVTCLSVFNHNFFSAKKTLAVLKGPGTKSSNGIGNSPIPTPPPPPPPPPPNPTSIPPWLLSLPPLLRRIDGLIPNDMKLLQPLFFLELRGGSPLFLPQRSTPRRGRAKLNGDPGFFRDVL